MSDALVVQDIVDSFLDGRTSLDAAGVEELWWIIAARQTPGTEHGLEAFQDLLVSFEGSSDGLQFKLGAWRWDLKSNTFNLAVSSLLIGGFLEVADLVHIPGYTLPAVLAVLFKVDAIRIEGKDKELLLILEERTGKDGRLRTVEELYGLLPVNEQNHIAPSDFAVFVEKLRQAGRAEQLADGIVSLVPEEESPFLKINIKW